jgi:hypothetical protein
MKYMFITIQEFKNNGGILYKGRKIYQLIDFKLIGEYDENLEFNDLNYIQIELIPVYK